MIALVLGGKGFIGSSLITRLHEQGHTVRVLGHGPPPAFTSKRLNFFSSDFNLESDYSSMLQGCDAVFHLISTTLPTNSNAGPLADVQGNLLPTLHLLDQMKKFGVTRLIFPSSGGTVYGQARYLPIDEKHPTSPIVSYGVTKLAIEKYIGLYQHAFGLSPICLRISNPYGPGFRRNSPQGAIGAFLNKALNDQPIEVWGSGDVQRDYLYIDDLIDAFMAAAVYKGREWIFNISTGVGTSLNEVLEMVATVTDKKLNICRRDGRSFDVQTNYLDNTLARKELDWQPRTPLALGIERTAYWLRNHPH